MPPLSKLAQAQVARRAAVAQAGQHPYTDEDAETTQRAVALGTAAAVAVIRASQHDGDSEPPTARKWHRLSGHAKTAGAIVAALGALAAVLAEAWDAVKRWL